MMKKNTSLRRPIWLSFLVMLGMAVIALVRFTIRSIAWAAGKTSLLLEMVGTKREADSGTLGSIATAKPNVPANRKVVVTVNTAPAPRDEEFMAADRIVSIRLDPPVAVLNLRIYYKQKVIKREMIVTEQRLRTLMQGRHHSLGEVAFDPVKGMEMIKDETVQKAQDLINSTGNLKVSKAKVKPAERTEKLAQPRQEKVVAPRQQVEIKPVEPKAAAVPKVQPPPEHPATPRNSYVPKPTVGVTFEGKLVAAGSRTFRPEGRAPYETFEAMLKLDNGVDVPLRGAELERELQRFNVLIGERVAITPMGKVPVTLPSGDEGSKNVYRVARLDGAK
jgi:flagellar basal body rod protein FlgC